MEIIGTRGDGTVVRELDDDETPESQCEPGDVYVQEDSEPGQEGAWYVCMWDGREAFDGGVPSSYAEAVALALAE